MTPEEDTLPKLLRRNYERWGDRVVAIRDKDFGIWQEYTWKYEYEQVKYFGLGLLSLGLKPGDRVAILGDNEPEWYWAAFATQAVHGIVVALFTDAIPDEIEYIVNHSEAKFAVARDQEQVDKFLRIWDKLSHTERVIWWYWKGMGAYTEPFLMDWKKVIEMGRQYEEEHPGVFEQLISETKPDDLANIYYTSGTTGLPKGAMCTHQALIGSTRVTLDLVPISETDDILCYLPPAWVGESFFGFVPHLLNGAKLNCLEEPETVHHDIREVAPCLILGGPRQWEGWVSMVRAKIDEAGIFERLAYKAFMPIGLRVGKLSVAGKRPDPFLRFLYWIGDFILFKPIRDYIGLTNARFPATAGSVLGPDTIEFFRGIGVELKQVYGSTEGGMISGHRGDDFKLETVGPPLDVVQVRVAEDGEILVRSPFPFSGFHKQMELYKEVVDNDGWWYSGDAGHIEEESGHLVYLDRKSELGELRTGVKYSPQYIESRLRFSPYIKDSIIIGQDRDYVTAIVDIDFANVGRWAERRRVPYTTFTDLSQKLEVAQLVREDIDRVNQFVPADTRVMKFVCLHKEFDADEGDLTRTRKLKRTSLEKRYHELVDAMYSGSEELFVEAPITYQDGRVGTVRTHLRIWKSKAGEDTFTGGG
ncbi:MAG TPA: long-chain fatty acid--CoA ligase [Dehalococcoidia bacterium]|nr:long-chain fatty acid--CoA ligase [Dehalococcoidia bacterium]